MTLLTVLSLVRPNGHLFCGCVCLRSLSEFHERGPNTCTVEGPRPESEITLENMSRIIITSPQARGACVRHLGPASGGSVSAAMLIERSGDARKAVNRLKAYYRHAAAGGSLATNCYLQNENMQDAFSRWHGDRYVFARMSAVLGRARRRRGAMLVVLWRRWQQRTSTSRQMIRAQLYAVVVALHRLLTGLQAEHASRGVDVKRG